VGAKLEADEGAKFCWPWYIGARVLSSIPFSDFSGGALIALVYAGSLSIVSVLLVVVCKSWLCCLFDERLIISAIQYLEF
jgi:hypothetical protein